MKQIMFYVILLLFITSCIGVFKDKVIGNYFLIATDYEIYDMSLSYKLSTGNFVGVVNPAVVAIGYNEAFIIVKQHPRNWPNLPDKSTTNYFIVPTQRPVQQWPDENKIGPLTLREFLKKRKELGLPKDLTFTRIFDTLH